MLLLVVGERDEMCFVFVAVLFVEHLKEITATFYKLDGVSRFQVFGWRCLANEAYAPCPDK